ncbi:arginase family protein [Cystobacter fuscus]|uniref:arginase family protein n=1 Tax=Cystobacter fuscus TaxID=43 RepID=UPI002B31A636|nr:arginase family protein [Cystobacter fuscus]
MTSDLVMRAPGRTIFGVPLWAPEQPCDVVFVGVPADMGMLGIRSTQGGPGALRDASIVFPEVRDDANRPVGWYDYPQRRVLLAGRQLRDAGDFPYDRRQGPEQLESLPDLYAALRESSRLLVILGGDHSLSYWMGRSLSGEGVVWVDGHEDAGRVQGEVPHHANVVSYVERLDTVGCVVQYGLRGLIPALRRDPPPQRTLCERPEEVVAALRRYGITEVALSIDVDVLDPSVMPSVSSPLPEGLGFADLLTLVSTLTRGGISIRVLELMEFAPVGEADRLPALALVKFLVRVVDACLAR